MTVADLIAELQKQPPDRRVLVERHSTMDGDAYTCEFDLQLAYVDEHDIQRSSGADDQIVVMIR